MISLHVYMYTKCVPSALRGQKRASDPLELELRITIIHHLGVVT